MREPCSGTSRAIGSLAVQALIEEAMLAPKPGLVTPFTRGAHSDMDFHTFVASAIALRPCFDACASAGEVAGRDPGTRLPVLLKVLRRIGQEGEGAMFRATGGVNTHKGAIFCLGLLSAALALVRSRGTECASLGEGACEVVAGICPGLVERDMPRAAVTQPLSAGERLYREHGLRGARGQAQDGYPLLRSKLLPLLRVGCTGNRERFRVACLDALMLSMSQLEDSCLLSRGGFAGLKSGQRGATEVILAGGAGTVRGREALRVLDESLCVAGLSPGGSADMVAAGIFLTRAERRFGNASGLVSSCPRKIA
jgi:triphosphoribosyl-dephospho-CoA synthase